MYIHWTFAFIILQAWLCIGVFVLQSLWYIRIRMLYDVPVGGELLLEKIEKIEKSKAIEFGHKWYLSCLVSDSFQNYFTKGHVAMMDSCQVMTQSWGFSY